MILSHSDEDGSYIIEAVMRYLKKVESCFVKSWSTFYSLDRSTPKNT